MPRAHIRITAWRKGASTWKIQLKDVSPSTILSVVCMVWCTTHDARKDEKIVRRPALPYTTNKKNHFRDRSWNLKKRKIPGPILQLPLALLYPVFAFFPFFSSPNRVELLLHALTHYCSSEGAEWKLRWNSWEPHNEGHSGLFWSSRTRYVGVELVSPVSVFLPSTLACSWLSLLWSFDPVRCHRKQPYSLASVHIISESIERNNNGQPITYVVGDQDMSSWVLNA